MKFPPLAYAFKATVNDYVNNTDAHDRRGGVIDRQVRAAQVVRFMHTIMLYAEEAGIEERNFSNILHGIFTPQSQSTWAQQVVDNEHFQKIYQEYRENSTLVYSNIDIHDYANYRYSNDQFNFNQFEGRDEDSIREWMAESAYASDIRRGWEDYREVTSMMRLVDEVVVPEMDNIAVFDGGSVDQYPYFNTPQVAEFIEDMSQRGLLEMSGDSNKSAFVNPKYVSEYYDEEVLKYGVLGWRPETQVAIDPSLVADDERLTASGEILRNGVKIFAYEKNDEVLYGVSSLRGKLSNDNLSLEEARKYDVTTFIDYHEKMMVYGSDFHFDVRPTRYHEVIMDGKTEYQYEQEVYLDGDLKDYAKNQHSWLSHEEDSSYELGAFSDFARIDTAEMQPEEATTTMSPHEQKIAQGMSLVEVAGVVEDAAAAPEHEPAVSPLQDSRTQHAEPIPQTVTDDIEL